MGEPEPCCLVFFEHLQCSCISLTSNHWPMELFATPRFQWHWPPSWGMRKSHWPGMKNNTLGIEQISKHPREIRVPRRDLLKIIWWSIVGGTTRSNSWNSNALLHAQLTCLKQIRWNIPKPPCFGNQINCCRTSQTTNLAICIKCSYRKGNMIRWTLCKRCFKKWRCHFCMQKLKGVSQGSLENKNKKIKHQ